MIRTFLLSIVIFILALTTYLYFYLGVYKKVEVSLESRGPFYMLFKEHIGPYHEIGSTIQAVEQFARSANLLCATTFGEFLDDPESMDQDRLRSHAGCLLSAAPSTAIDGFKFEERSARMYAVGQFSGSPAIGPFKVYPKVKKFLGEKRAQNPKPVIETYLVNGTSVHTEYLFPFDNIP